MVGKIERVPLREVWKHEEYDFSKWLEENIDILGDEIGLDLENTESEVSAGSFSIDLVAKDKLGNSVVIENQLERSDHDHLGKLLTYLTMWDAKTAIWIVKEPRVEHIKAINWLNESTNADFYMLKIEAIKIGNSEPAPLLTEIVGPSEEARIVGKSKRAQNETQKLMQKFWIGLLDRARNQTSLFNNISPSTSNYIGMDAGVHGFYYYFIIKQRSCRVELYMYSSELVDPESINNQLEANIAGIEKDFNGELGWVPMSGGRKSCKIMKQLEIGGYKSDESDWPQIQDSMIDAMIRLEKALKPYLDNLYTK